MKVTRNVILDLIPLVQAGEASQDTQNLVEAYLETDPDFARQLHNGLQAEMPEEIPFARMQEEEMKTFKQVKMLFWRSAIYLALAVFFGLLTIAFSFGPQGARWLWADFPMGAVICSVLGVICGIAFAWSVLGSKRTSL